MVGLYLHTYNLGGDVHAGTMLTKSLHKLKLSGRSDVQQQDVEFDLSYVGSLTPSPSPARNGPDIVFSSPEGYYL